MKLAIERLLEEKSPTSERIDAFLAEHSLPIVAPGSATFVYRGEADAVRLEHFVFGIPSSEPLRRMPGSDLWYLTLDLPEGARVEYRFSVERGGKSETLLDPLNPRQARDPFAVNSVCQGYGYREPEWIHPEPGVLGGSLEEFHLASKALDMEKRVLVYRPARYRPSRRYPLLVVHDGSDFLEYAGLAPVLDNLIARLEIPSLVVAMIDPADREEEYAASGAHADFLVRELLPELGARYPLRDAPRDRCLMGASLGAVAALSTAWRHPGLFGSLMLLSGAFAFRDVGAGSDEEARERIEAFMAEVRDESLRPAERAYVSAGIFESLIYENRALVPRLAQSGVDVRFVEARDGHNWEAWRDRLREGLSWIFPGPLWLVYP